MRSLSAILLSLTLIGGCAANPAPTPSPSPSPFPTLRPTPSPAVDPTSSLGPTLAPTLAPTAQPTAAPTAVSTSTPFPVGFEIDLYEDGDFISEYTKYMCLPAAMQVMINIIRDGPQDNSREYQDHLYALARNYLPDVCVNCETGATPEGWSGGLNDEGYGPYEMVIVPTMEGAIQLAAKRLRMTDKPVGLLTWRGAHSWVMSGFVSDNDPLTTDDFTVGGIYVEDVWYPRISSIWGPSDPPDTLVGMDRLGVDFRKYNRPNQQDPDKDGQYVMIIPVIEGEGP